MSTYQSIAQSAHCSVSCILKIYTKAGFSTPSRIKEAKKALFRFQKAPLEETLLKKGLPDGLTKKEWEEAVRSCSTRNTASVDVHIYYLLRSLEPDFNHNKKVCEVYYNKIEARECRIVAVKLQKLKKCLEKLQNSP